MIRYEKITPFLPGNRPMAFMECAVFVPLQNKQRFMQETIPLDCGVFECARQNRASEFLVF
jgi:hypothetical protein